ncbi:MAG: hypothetical protein JWN27_3988 [Candidatus Eremiobacteraeota bacterium]|nr:hypothetical protein [Candidatus Eremiobacteraeota bacterium]
MLRPILAALILVALSGAAAQADDARPSTDSALAGTWKLTWNFSGAAFSMGGHYVQAYSDGHVHWSDSTRDPHARFDPTAMGVTRCEDTVQIQGADFDAMRDAARAIYELQLPDGSSGINTAFLELTVTRGGRDYVAGMLHYIPTLENLDPRLKRLNAVFARYGCGLSAPSRST